MRPTRSGVLGLLTLLSTALPASVSSEGRLGFRGVAAQGAAPLARGAGTSGPERLRVPDRARPPAPGADRILSVDHHVAVVSRVPSLEGQRTTLYVRERVLEGPALRAGSWEGRVLLFVHGAGTPAEVAFDPPAPGYSWMAHAARAGFDAFSVDMTGYGGSTRPTPMNDPCNLSESQQEDLVPLVLPETCPPSHPRALTTIESDWHDLDAAVEYVRSLRGVDRVHLVGWSLGGPRAAGYAARNPEKVASVVLLAPAYSRTRRTERPEVVPAEGTAMSKQSRDDFVGLWNRQAPCPGQLEPRVRERVWAAMLASDPVGSTWGTGVRRAPRVTLWGWGREEVSATRTPMLLVAGLTDGQVSPDRVREMYEDLGSERKVLLELECASHNAMWERGRERLFDATVQWLRDGAVDGVERGELRRGP